MNSVLVLSIKPEYAEKIYSGIKRFEFRKAPPRNLKAMYVMYESAPVSKMTGFIGFNGSFTVRAGAMVGLIKAVMGVGKKHAIELMGISERELINYAGGHNNFVTALLIGFADKDEGLGRFKIRPPQNWGTVRPAECLTPHEES